MPIDPDSLQTGTLLCKVVSLARGKNGFWTLFEFPNPTPIQDSETQKGSIIFSIDEQSYISMALFSLLLSYFFNEKI